VDTVVHLVAIIRGSRADFERVMAQGTRNVVAAAQAAGVRRFVLASALGLDERTKDAVPYYAAKWEMERAVRESGLEHVVFRPSFVFGRDGGVLPTFVRLARYAPVTPIVGPGTQRLQPIWVEDLAEYYARAVAEPAAANRTFELGGPDAVTWDEFWSRLKRILGARRPSVHVPFGAMRLQAALTERLPGAPVTRDQLTMLALGDNVVTDTAAVETFRIPLVALDEQLRRAV
jgi:NADH dehydrogenase